MLATWPNLPHLPHLGTTVPPWARQGEVESPPGTSRKRLTRCHTAPQVHMWALCCELVGVVADGTAAGIPAADSVEQAVESDFGGHTVAVDLSIVVPTAASSIDVAVIVDENDGGVGRIVVGNFPTPEHGPVIEDGRIDPAVDFDLHHLCTHHQQGVHGDQLPGIAIQL